MSLQHMNIYATNIEAVDRKGYKLFSPDFKQIYTYLDPYKRRFNLTIVLSILQALVFLLLPVLAGIALDEVLNVVLRETGATGITDLPGKLPTDTGRLLEIASLAFNSLVNILVLLLLSVFATAIIMYVRMWENQKIGNKIIYDLRNDIFKSLQRQSYSFYDKQQVGDLVARTTSDVNLLREVLAQQLAFFIRELLQLALALAVMFVFNPILATLSACIMPFIFTIMYFYRRRMHPLFLASRKSYGQVASRVEETVTGVRVVRAFAQEQAEKHRFHEKNDDYYNKAMGIARLTSWFDPVVGLVNTVGLIIIIFIGGTFYVEGIMTIGNIFTFILLMNFAQGPVRFVGVFLGNMSQVNAACERLTEVLNSQPEISQPASATVKDIEGLVEFRNVSFKYPGTTKQVLDNVSFTVQPGETVAILGGTGAGKSTIVNLIPRLYNVTEGSGGVFIDGVDVREMDLQSLRSQVAVVSQEVFLFSRTIKQNIALARDEGNVSMEEITRAARLASIHDFIESLPEQYETIVGERGVTLSGGQKQRVAIARAIISNPRILILDDATSSIDVDTEHEIQESFKELFSGKGSTTFIISQRLSTVRLADKIIVLDNNNIAQMGTHDELLKDTGGIYHRLHSTLAKEGTSA